MVRRPFCSPHHSITAQALTGGGKNPVPGEMSLASEGVLFLDELPEFSRRAIEVMRQPLESRKIVLARVHARYEFPANFILVAAMNPYVLCYVKRQNLSKLPVYFNIPGRLQHNPIYKGIYKKALFFQRSGGKYSLSISSNFYGLAYA